MLETFIIAKLLTLAALAFLVAIIWTPFLTNVLYKYKLGKNIRSAVSAPMFAELHKKKAGVPTMGGVLMWGTTIFLALILAVLSHWGVELWGFDVFEHLSFLSRKETWLPLGALVIAGLIGMADDLANIYKIGPHGGGIRISHRLFLYTVIAAVGAWWFYVKLGWNFLHIPFVGDVMIGPWYIPFFIAVIVGTAFSVNETDGLDGLAGGTLATAFSVFGVIALLQGKEDLAAFCAVIVGTLLAFLWFNINPARFIMGDTGAMSLGVTLGIVAMLTNSALFLPLIGLVFVAEALSAVIQISSKKLFGRKVFKIAPIHHHFEASGWPEPKVVMRFWVVSWIAGGLGLALVLMDSIGL